MRSYILLALLLCATCRLKGVHAIGEDRPSLEALPRRFRMICWNVQKGKDRHFGRDLELGVEQLVPDLLLLQEVHPDRLPERIPGGSFAPSWSYPWPGGRAVGVATLSRAAVLEKAALQTDTRELGVTAPKTSIATTHRLANGEVLLVLNVHLLAFEGGKLKNFRRQLEDLATRMREHEGPVLLAGDFNTWSMACLEAVRVIARGAGLTEVEAFAAPWTTADKGSDFWNRMFGIDPSLPLDRVFHRGLEVSGARVLEHDSSDHRPLLVDFRVAE